MSKYKVNGEGWHYDNAVYRAVTGTCFYFEVGADDIDKVIDYASISGFDIEQRYTDQQLELEKDGWTPWAGGDEPPVDASLDGQIYTEKIEAASLSLASDWNHCGDDTDIIAYRLTNNDFYHNGKRVVLEEGDSLKTRGLSEEDIRSAWKCFVAAGAIPYNDTVVGNMGWPCIRWKPTKNWVIGSSVVDEDRQLTLAQVLNAENAKAEEKTACCVACSHEWKTKSDVNLGPCSKCGDYVFGNIHENDTPEPEWKEGELPPSNTVCECYHESEKPEQCRFIESNGIQSVVQWSKFNKGGYDVLGKDWKFRPIKSHRGKVIERANTYLKAHHWTDGEKLNALYDLGMLKMPEGE